MQILDLAIVSHDSNFRKRSESIAEFFKFHFETYQSDDDFFDGSKAYRNIVTVVLDCSHFEKANDVAGLVQVAKQSSPKSFIIAVVNAKLTGEDARIIKTSGSSIVILENEYFATSKVEFILTQIIRAIYIPIKTVDLFEDSEPDFALYYLMPVNRKFLKVAKPGQTIRKDFLEKYKEVGDLYIERSAFKSWTEYSNSFPVHGSEGLLRSCRLKFIQLNQSFLNLVLLVADQSSGASFAYGRELYETCHSFATDLLNLLKSIDDPWMIISNSAIGDFGSVERSPAIASYAGLLSVQSHIGDPVEVMIGALLADVGYLDLNPVVTQKIRNSSPEVLDSAEILEYQKHPLFSLNQCLSRKLPLTETIKNIILQSHERVDQTGYPNKIRIDKITEESMLIRLCSELDSRSQIRMGEKRQDIRAVKEQMSQTIMDEAGNYSFGFLLKINKLLKQNAAVQASL